MPKSHDCCLLCCWKKSVVLSLLLLALLSAPTPAGSLLPAVFVSALQHPLRFTVTENELTKDIYTPFCAQVYSRATIIMYVLSYVTNGIASFRQ